MKKRFIIYITSCLLFLSSCSNYLDIVPDNVATIDNAFTMRSTAEKFLVTCYSYLPSHSLPFAGNPAFTAGDEIWFYSYITFSTGAWQIARGNQNIVNPFVNFWDGREEGKPMFTALRDCNIFLENIGKVPGLDEFERNRWIAEVKFLKAYYHFWLLRMYGPIPLIRDNLPISAGTQEVKVYREPVDDGIDYIVQLLDEAAKDLPEIIQSQVQELGRITKPIALSLKARVLTTAASPLFNGNPDYAGFKGSDGKLLFSPQQDPAKWAKALTACREAIASCHAAGNMLYYYNPSVVVFPLSAHTITELSIRASITERWNPEVIWANSSSRANSLQQHSQPRLYPNEGHFGATQSTFAPTLKMAELFYSKNGVPISEDKTWNYANRFDLKTATSEDRLFIKEGNAAPLLHFNREVRFYANLGFDGGRWYGQGRFADTDNFYVEAKSGQTAASHATKLSATGYWPKKLVNYKNTATPEGYVVETYPWPVIRLADLYLLMAESANEVNGPVAEAYEYINLVRKRAGLKTVQESWTNFSLQPAKHTTQSGLRDIIQQERLIELAFEGQRFWDLRRWKKAETVLNQPVKGWNLEGENAQAYYQVRTLYNQQFNKRDYLWPIREESIIVNRNLVQNPGW